jgi:hypothetical protein
MKAVGHKTLGILKTLALGFSIAAVAVPLAQADAVDRGLLAAGATGGVQVSSDVGGLDPLIGDAIRAEQASPELDPLIADAIRHAQPDFWNYDPRTGEKTSNTSPGLGPGDLARLYSPTGDVSPDGRALDFRTPSPLPSPISTAGDNGFQWDDAGIGAGAMLALVVMGAVAGTRLIRRGHGLLPSR